jgi:hypothetical protein
MGQSMTDHPILYAGYNYTTINADEVNGAGVNDEISPLFFDSFIGMKVLVVTPEMLADFENTCPDFIAPAEVDTIVWPAEPWTVIIRRAA